MILNAIVRYGPEESVLSYLESASGYTGIAFAIADNGPGRSNAVEALAASPQVARITCYEDNPGYFPSAFRVADEAIKAGAKSDWVIVSNTDIDVDWLALIEHLSRFDSNQSIVIAPRVIDLPGNVEKNPHLVERPSRSRLLRVKYATLNRPFFAAYRALHSFRSRHYGDPEHPAITQGGETPRIYAAHGSILILSTSLFHTIRESAEEAVLFSEEVWLAEKCANIGAVIIYEPSLVVYHHAHAMTSLIPSNHRLQLWRRGSAASLEFFDRSDRNASKH